MSIAHCKRQFYWRQWVAALGASSTMLGVNLDVVWDIGIDYYASKWSLAAGMILIIVGAIFGTVVADTFGRRKTLLGTSVFVIPRILAPHFSAPFSIWTNMLFVSFGTGITCVAVPLYICEIADAKNRGKLMVVQQSVYYLGRFVVWSMHAVFQIYDDEHSEENLIPQTALLLFSVIFNLVIVWTYPDTPQYLIWKKMYQETANSLAFFRGETNRGRIELDRTIMLRNQSVNDDFNGGWCDRIKETFRFRNQRSLMIILFMIVIRLAAGRERNLLGQIYSVVPYLRSETNLIPLIGFYAVSLIASVLVIFTIRIVGQKIFLLLVIWTSLLAGVMGELTVTEDDQFPASILYIQHLGHLLFTAVLLSYVGEFFLIEIRSIAIATVVGFEVFVRFAYLLINEILTASEFTEKQMPYSPQRFHFHCIEFLLAFCLVMIYFPKTNKVSSSEIKGEILANGKCVLVEKLALY